MVQEEGARSKPEGEPINDERRSHVSTSTQKQTLSDDDVNVINQREGH